jgi:hypothetical protein
LKDEVTGASLKDEVTGASCAASADAGARPGVAPRLLAVTVLAARAEPALDLVLFFCGADMG